jgi:mono/diheme cytochrome c family protein/plastocyanin
MKIKSELVTRLLVAVFLLGIVAFPLLTWARTPLIHASMAESGGWNPDVIQGKVGQRLHLRFTSDDVMHGFAVGQVGMQAVDVEPGKVSEVTLNFDRPGIYTFYCTRWCGMNHWRMRGTIEVSGEAQEPAPEAGGDIPLFVSLGLNLDATHPAETWPATKPSAQRGSELLAGTSIDTSADTYRSTSPTQIFQKLGSTDWSEAQRWDVVAAIWQTNTSVEGLVEGRTLFAQNCAACHGEGGAGDGVFADQLETAGMASQQGMTGSQNMSMTRPVDFTQTDLLGASPALLQGKILRGGMGTGMPMWGSIFNDEQLWNLVAYLYTFQFEP